MKPGQVVALIVGAILALGAPALIYVVLSQPDVTTRIGLIRLLIALGVLGGVLMLAAIGALQQVASAGAELVRAWRGKSGT